MSRLLPFLLSVLSAALLAAAWWVPGTTACAVLGWLSVLALVGLTKSTRVSYGAMALCGTLTYLLGFYWLFFTIKDFGGFDYFAAALIFLLFVVVSSNQYLIFLFFYRGLPRVFDRFGFRIACAWVSSEFFSLRIFPWSMGHSQLGFTHFVQFADILGTPAIAFLMLWLVEAGWRFVREGERRATLAVPACLAVASLFYGHNRIAHFETTNSEKVAVTLIQANISTAEKRNVRFFLRNKERYEELSRGAAKPGSIVIWPETVITDFISDDITSISQDERVPYLGPDIGMLVGALTYRSQKEFFNSALAILPGGKIAAPYHKRVLMPFGEFTPFSETFPWLKEINATAGEFTAGKSVSIYEYTFGGANPRTVKLSPLICYEDIAPRLSREASLAGADVLVNITNDAWFGNTAAPYQHHLIAAFRAIENRKFLLRSTNSGLTAIVDPLGRTVASLAPFSDGVLNYTISLPRENTYYVTLFGDGLWWALSGLILGISVVNAMRRRHEKDSVSASPESV